VEFGLLVWRLFFAFAQTTDDSYVSRGRRFYCRSIGAVFEVDGLGNGLTIDIDDCVLVLLRTGHVQNVELVLPVDRVGRGAQGHVITDRVGLVNDAGVVVFQAEIESLASRTVVVSHQRILAVSARFRVSLGNTDDLAPHRLAVSDLYRGGLGLKDAVYLRKGHARFHAVDSGGRHGVVAVDRDLVFVGLSGRKYNGLLGEVILNGSNEMPSSVSDSEVEPAHAAGVPEDEILSRTVDECECPGDRLVRHVGGAIQLEIGLNLGGGTGNEHADRCYKEKESDRFHDK